MWLHHPQPGNHAKDSKSNRRGYPCDRWFFPTSYNIRYSSLGRLLVFRSAFEKLKQFSDELLDWICTHLCPFKEIILSSRALSRNRFSKASSPLALPIRNGIFILLLFWGSTGHLKNMFIIPATFLKWVTAINKSTEQFLKTFSRCRQDI